MVCLHKNTRWLHLSTKECLEADCGDDVEVCDLAVCIDCGMDVN